jgi:hypothetical protein
MVRATDSWHPLLSEPRFIAMVTIVSVFSLRCELDHPRVVSLATGSQSFPKLLLPTVKSSTLLSN